MQLKTKQITVRMTLTDYNRLQEIKKHWLTNGVKLEHGKIVRDVLLNFPCD
jgi:hypothetical protein